MNQVKLFGVFGTVGILVSLQSAMATGNYPERVQVKINSVVRQDASERLRTALDQYNQNLSNESALVDVVKKNGLGDADVAQLSVYTRELGRSLPKAELKDGALSIKDGGHSIVIGFDEFWHQAMRVNGKIFRWNWSKSTSENLRKYDALFNSKNKSTSWLRLPALIESAWADDIFRIKAAGLQLYFTVSRVGEMGGQLDRLNTKVKAMIALCEAPEPAAGDDDPFLKAVMQGTLDAQKYESTILLKNCGSVKNYAKKPVGVMRGVVGEPNGMPVYPKVPADLCGNLDHLAKCVRSQMDPAAVSNSHKKEKPPTDREEWYEPAQPTKAGAAK